jgi:hypothetical protein
MAKVLMGPIVTAAVGKTAGTIMAYNRAGAYARGRVKPGAMDTAANATTKRHWYHGAKSWSANLTQDDRDTWNSWVTGFTVLDRFGNQIHLSGFQAFMSCNKHLLDIGASPRSRAPANRAVTDPGGFSVTVVSPYPVDLEITPVHNPQSYEAVVITAHAPQPPGRALFRTTHMSTIEIIYPSTPPAWDVTDAYRNKYQELPNWYGIVLGLYYINSENGGGSPKYNLVTIVPPP